MHILMTFKSLEKAQLSMFSKMIRMPKIWKVCVVSHFKIYDGKFDFFYQNGYQMVILAVTNLAVCIVNISCKSFMLHGMSDSEHY